MLATAAFNAGVLTVHGDSGGEVVSLQYDASQNLVVVANSTTIYSSPQSVYRADFFAGGGNDFYSNQTNIPSRFFGGDGNDDFTGGSANDLVYGNAGNDTLRGGAGDDRLAGGDGADLMYGGVGNDRVLGGHGQDVGYGGDGDDILAGHTEYDRLLGQNGMDRLIGGLGNDALFGGEGDDILSGGPGNDNMHGNQGSDRMFGGIGDDNMLGGSEADVIRGENGNDYMDGEAGNDNISGALGDDTIHGGDGDDVALGLAGNDRILGGDGDDHLRGGDGDDYVNGEFGSDVILGEAGHDQLRNTGGQSRLFGGVGNDSLWGFNNDVYNSESGADRILSQTSGRIYHSDLTAEDVVIQVPFVWNHRPDGWSLEMVNEIDLAFAQLVSATGNNELLRMPETGEGLVVTYRDWLGGDWVNLGHQGFFQVARWNTSLPQANDFLRAEFIQQVGLIWASEAALTNVDSSLSGRYSQFLSYSSWQTQDPQDLNFSPSSNGRWWYDHRVEFASEYGKEKPQADLASYWRLYFSDTTSNSPKYTWVSDLFDDLSQL